MSVIEQWHRELADGRRTTTTFDDLYWRACKDIKDREFEAYVRPQREYVARLRGQAVETRPPVVSTDTPAPRRSVFRPVRFG